MLVVEGYMINIEVCVFHVYPWFKWFKLHSAHVYFKQWTISTIDQVFNWIALPLFRLINSSPSFQGKIKWKKYRFLLSNDGKKDQTTTKEYKRKGIFIKWHRIRFVSYHYGFPRMKIIIFKEEIVYRIRTRKKLD